MLTNAIREFLTIFMEDTNAKATFLFRISSALRGLAFYKGVLSFKLCLSLVIHAY
jgi:hypothetical protein